MPPYRTPRFLDARTRSLQQPRQERQRDRRYSRDERKSQPLSVLRVRDGGSVQPLHERLDAVPRKRIAFCRCPTARCAVGGRASLAEGTRTLHQRAERKAQLLGVQPSVGSVLAGVPS